MISKISSILLISYRIVKMMKIFWVENYVNISLEKALWRKMFDMNVMCIYRYNIHIDIELENIILISDTINEFWWKFPFNALNSFHYNDEKFLRTFWSISWAPSQFQLFHLIETLIMKLLHMILWFSLPFLNFYLH